MINNTGLSNVNPDILAIESEGFKLTGPDSQKAAWDLANLDTAVGAFNRFDSLQLKKYETRNEAVLQPEELNKQFPDIQTKFDEPMNLSVAKTIADRQRERQEMQRRVNAGPQDGWYGFTNKWGANLLAHATDPVELGAGVVVGMALPAGIAAGTLGRTFIEGALGNLVTEPLVYAANKQENVDYDIESALVGAIGTAAGFTALHGAVKLGNGALNRYLGRTSQKNTQVIQNVAAGQVLEGKKIDVDPVIKELIGDTNIPKADFAKVTNEAIPDTTFYSPKELVTTDVNAKSAVISDDYGQGVYLTDDQVVANNAAARRVSDSDGSVLSGKVQAQLADLDVPNAKFSEAVTAALEGNKTKIDLELSGKEIFEQIHDAIESGSLPKDFLDKLKQQASNRGIDGYRFTVDNLGGQPHSPHNAVMLFDSGKFLKDENFIPDSNALPKISQEEVQAQYAKNQSIESSIHYEPDSYAKFKEMQKNRPMPAKAVELKKQLESINEEIELSLKALGEDATGSKELLSVKEELKIDAQKAEAESTALKAAADCIARGG